MVVCPCACWPDSGGSVAEALTYDLEGEGGQLRIPMNAENYVVTIVVTSQDRVTQSRYIIDLSRNNAAVEISDAVSDIRNAKVRWPAVLGTFAVCFGTYKEGFRRLLLFTEIRHYTFKISCRASMRLEFVILPHIWGRPKTRAEGGISAINTRKYPGFPMLVPKFYVNTESVTRIVPVACKLRTQTDTLGRWGLFLARTEPNRADTPSFTSSDHGT